MYNYRGTVERVIDGDTVVLNLDLGFHVTARGVRVRLLNVFAPELKKNKRDPDGAGEFAKSELERLLPVGAAVELESRSLDKYGRSLGFISAESGPTNSLMIEWMTKGEENVD